MLAILPPLFFLTALMGSPIPGFLAFLLIGIFALVRTPVTNALEWTRQDTGLSLCFMSIAAFKMLSALWSDQPQLALANAGWHLYFLFWPLILIGLVRCQANMQLTERALAAGLVCFGLYAAALAVSGDTICMPGVRQNVGILAQLTMTLGIWNVLTLTRPDTARQWRSLHGAAVLCTLVILILSTRRLELIGFIGLTGLVVLYRLQKQLTPWRLLLVALVGAAALGILIYLRREKFSEGFAELLTYLYHRHEHPEVIFTSWGARLEMWRTAWAAFLDHPILGISASARPYNMQAWGGPDDMALFGHRHFHSHLMQILVEGGLVGLTLMLLTLGYSIKQMVLKAHDTHPEAALLSASLLGAYAMEGLASAALQYDKPNALLVVASAWVWSQIRSAGKGRKAEITRSSPI